LLLHEVTIRSRSCGVFQFDFPVIPRDQDGSTPCLHFKWGSERAVCSHIRNHWIENQGYNFWLHQLENGCRSSAVRGQNAAPRPNTHHQALSPFRDIDVIRKKCSLSLNPIRVSRYVYDTSTKRYRINCPDPTLREYVLSRFKPLSDPPLSHFHGIHCVVMHRLTRLPLSSTRTYRPTSQTASARRQLDS
jgi:hypothetical protein